MHETLPYPLEFVGSWIMARSMQGKEGEHARIPVANPIALLPQNFVLDVETPAGGTEIGAGAAVEAGKRDILPERSVKKFGGHFFFQVVRGNHGRDLFPGRPFQGFGRRKRPIVRSTSAGRFFPGMLLLCR